MYRCAHFVHDLCVFVQEAYMAVVEYFGENPKTLAPNTFFSVFSRFVHAYRVSAHQKLIHVAACKL